MNIYNKIIEYKKHQKRMDVLNDFHKSDPFVYAVYNVELDKMTNRLIKVKFHYGENNTTSFLCYKQYSPTLFNKLTKLL